MKRKLFVLLAAIMSCLLVFGACGDVKADEQACNLVELSTWHFTSGVPNNVIILNDELGGEYRCRVNGGHFYIQGYFNDGSWFTLTSGAKLSWTDWAKDTDGNYIYLNEKDYPVYADFLLTVDNKIKGYAVVRIDFVNEIEQSAVILKSVVFNDGASVSLTEAEKRIAQVKKSDKNI